MQYILTQEEYDRLVPKYKLVEAESKINRLNKKVLELSGYTCSMDQPRPMTYCDDCPISGLNLNTCSSRNKRYSK